MILSDISVQRPVLAAVLSLLLVAFGFVAFQKTPLREYPDIDPPVVSIETNYRGAAASVVETRITEIIEDRISGVEGIRFIESSSQDGRSRINVEFNVERDIDGAANDIRDRVAGVADDLPDEADPPDIQKVDSNEDVIMWLNLQSDRMTVPELTDYAERYLVDRFSVLDGVARVRIGGEQRFAMRIWLDRVELAARGITVNEVETALRADNVELPAGSIESIEKQFTVRVARAFRTAQDFQSLVIGRGANGYLVRLGDVARVELGTEEDRTFFRGNQTPMVGLGIIKQSTANTLEVARAAIRQMKIVNEILPEGMTIEQSFDSSVFVEKAIAEVFLTLFISIGLVVLVIYLFLGSVRAMLVPAVTVPISIIATFIVIYSLGFSVNLLTLLALVLAIGLVVDDAIVVIENIHRRIDEFGETPLVAAFRGTREVGFAVIATTLVLVAVFVPLVFLEGDLGRLFSEFAITITAAVCFSSFVALSLSPMLASKLLRKNHQTNRLTGAFDKGFERLRQIYAGHLEKILARPLWSLLVFVLLLVILTVSLQSLPSEYAPAEDRGTFFVLVNGPEGASYKFMEEYMTEIEERLMPYVKSSEMTRLLVRTPRSFGSIASFNSGIVICILNDWGKRRSAWKIMDEIRGKLADLPGVRAFPIMRQSFGGRTQKPVQFVLGGSTYQELLSWRDILLEKIEENNPGLVELDWDYKETKPQLKIKIDYNRAAELGVTIGNLGRTLETMLGSRRATTFINRGEEYEVIVEGERDRQRTPAAIDNIYVKSDRSGELIPLANLVRIEEFADSVELNRYNRVRAITIEANLAENLALGDALSYLEGLVAEHLPSEAIVDYKGQSQDFKYSGESITFVFILGIVVVYLVLAAQFESFIHPLVIMLTVPLAIVGGLIGLLFAAKSLNIFTQIGLIILVGLSAKNGILIVEFANQLRDRGMEFGQALRQAAQVRMRPIAMTGITTIAGAVPLVLAYGAGAETRIVIGIVIFSGVIAATFFTPWIVPVAYQALARYTGSPQQTKQQLEAELNKFRKDQE